MKCLNPKVVGGLALTGLAVFLITPGAFSSVLPLLFVAACPLSMVLMMRAMSGGQCSSRGGHGDQEHQTDVTGVGSSMSAAEAEIARLRAEVDQLKAQKAARSEADAAINSRSGDSRT